MDSNNFNEYDWIDKELPKVKKFFKKISGVLVGFANVHNLLIEKYYHYIPGWDFLFKHPAGGKCFIQVAQANDGYLTIWADWRIYDYDTGQGFDKHTEKITSSIAEDNLNQNLEHMFQTVMSWTKDDLTLIGQRSPEFPERMTREEFERDMARYPEPKK
jgi:hypothetical protein